MALMLGLDVGTSGAKALLCDGKGQVLSTALVEYPISSPYPLWMEQDPADWWRGAQQALREVIVQSGIHPQEIIGLGLTGQMHGAVFLDKDERVIRPALLWNDQRTAAECQEMTDKIGYTRLIEIAGNPALTGFQAPKILWLRNHEPQNFSRVEQVLLPKDYIRLLLTGERAADAADAAGTLLLDLKRRDYSQEILDKLDIPRKWLPKVYEGPQITGYIKKDIADRLGIPAGIPVIAGGGDNAAAAVGTGIVRKGVLSSSIGTSGVIFAHSDEIALDPQGRLHSFCHSVPGKYHLMAVELAAGGSFHWLRDTLRQVESLAGKNEQNGISYDQMTTAAARVTPGAEGLLFLPYLNGERTPHLDPFASGAFVGLTSRHGVDHMVRAVMEGVIYGMKDGLEIMRQLGLKVEQVRAIGGGGRSPLWRQMQADIYQAEVATLAAEEGPAYGAALLAGVGAGVFEDVDSAVKQCVKVTNIIHPDPNNVERYEQSYNVFTRIYGHLREDMHALADIAQGKALQ